MRLLVLLLSIAMPVVAWLSNTGTFGATNAEVSARYPTLLVPAGYAFSIWGLIFLLDLGYGARQATGREGRNAALARMAPWSALGFGATAAWMPLFSTGLYGLCVLVILMATVGTVRAAMRAGGRPDAAPAPARGALALHAGWLTLASALNIAQALVAYGVMRPDAMLGASLALLAVTTGVLLAINARLRSVAYATAAAWGLVAAYVGQSRSTLPGASTAATAALVAAGLVVAQVVWLRLRPRRRRGHH